MPGVGLPFRPEQSPTTPSVHRIRGEKLRERLPVIGMPSGGQVRGLVAWKSLMIEQQTGFVALAAKRKACDGVGTCRPACRTPGLDNSLVSNQFDLST